jgi:hypothetical protein
VVSEKKIFFLNWSVLTLFAQPQRPQGAGNLKFTIYIPLLPNMLHINLKRIGTVVIKKKLKMLKC